MTSSHIRILRGAAALALVTVFTLAATQPTFAQTETLLYRFCLGSTACPDGYDPSSTPIVDAEGNVYGTTVFGGANNSGTVFKVSPDGTETLLYNFGANSTDGVQPYGSLLRDKSGNLYGTTEGGGDYSSGAIFKISPDGTETILHSFNPNGTDGRFPMAGIIRDATGNLYGTTAGGGPYNDGGVLFRLSTNGTETILHSFGNGTDAKSPSATLTMDREGNLYGTALQGGTYNAGAVFKVSQDGTETVLHNFDPANGDGSGPTGGVIMDKNGNLYGTTEYGGDFSHGILFKLSPNGTETVLHRFGYKTDGIFPQSNLIMDAQGNLYGTTFSGGGISSNGKVSIGTVFEFRTDGTEIILHRFIPINLDGYEPVGGLTMGGKGVLYGTTSNGGGSNYGGGTVFKITP